LFGLVISSAENKINFRFLGFGFWIEDEDKGGR